MNIVVSIIIAALVFCLIIVLHELGHFTAAKLCGMKVFEFSIGMGPAILKKKHKDTLYSLRLFPIGGFCSLGEDTETTDKDVFVNKPVGFRIITIAAGAIMNLLLGFVLAIILTIASGKVVTNTIGYFADDAVSAQSGLQMNDEIKKINGVKIYTYNDIIYQLGNDEDGVVDFVVKRNGEKIKVNGVKFEIQVNESTGARTLIYDFKLKSESLSVLNIVPASLNKTVYYSRIIFMSLGDIIKGKYGINDLQGPVGIVSAIGSVTKEIGIDIGFILNIAILITINVGIFNLLPLPALDGGRLIFLFIEAIRRKKIKTEIEGAIHFIGFALLMLLMVFVTFNDIKNLFVK